MDHPDDAPKQERAMCGSPHACSVSFAADVLHSSRRKNATGQHTSLVSKSGGKSPSDQSDREGGRTISIHCGRL
jgi:hypothetical protein